MKEFATRHALGAGLLRIGAQMVTESLVLTVLGGIVGLALGVAGVRLLSRFGLDNTPQGTSVVVDGTVVAFTLALAVVAGFVVSLIPIFAVHRMNLAQAIREEGRSGTASRGGRAVRRLLVTAQVAFAFMLLIGAGLLLVSFERVLAVRPGFDVSHVLTGIVSPPASRYKGDPELVAFWTRLRERVAALPGVEAAGATNVLPLSGDYNDSVILAEGYVMSPGESLISPYNSSISPGYFEAMRIPLRRGRFFATVRR